MIVEVRAAEGSDHAKLLVEDQLTFAAHQGAAGLRRSISRASPERGHRALP